MVKMSILGMPTLYGGRRGTISNMALKVFEQIFLRLSEEFLNQCLLLHIWVHNFRSSRAIEMKLTHVSLYILRNIGNKKYYIPFTNISGIGQFKHIFSSNFD